MPRRRSVGVLLFLALAAAGWAAAAWYLWQTDVPASLDLPQVEPSSYFERAIQDRAENYEGFLRWEFLLSELAVVVALGVYALVGPRFMRESAAGRIGTGMLLAMLGLAIAWLVTVPFSVVELWWHRRHDMAEEGYVDWVLGGWLALGGEFLFVSLAIVIVMGFARPLGERWWIPGAVVFVGLATLFAFVYPYLLPDQVPLREPELAARAERLAAEQGVEDVPVNVEQIDAVTDAPNAEAAGLGPSRRVLLWDTLLDGRFSEDEIGVVLAHEFAHHSRRHLPESLAWYALFAFPGAFLIARATRRRGGMREPRAVPLGLFVFVALSLLALPLQNAIGRHLEAEADWVALETSEDPDSARSLFEKFATEARTDPDPPTWAFVLAETHPTVMERLAMVEAWEARRGR